MSDFLLIIAGFSLFSIPIVFLIWIIKKIRKQPTRRIKFLSISLIIIFILFEAIGIATGCRHDYQIESTVPATCNSKGKYSLRCTKCDKTSYETLEKLEHNLVETERIEASIGVEGVVLYQCTLCSHLEKISLPALSEPETTECHHNWTDATCTAPKTCSICGETTGNAIEHEWIPATCTSAETCNKCHLQRGLATDHTWAEATCTNPRTCKICGDTSGYAKGHSESSWRVQSSDYVNATVLSIKHCTLCGKELEQKTTSVDQLHDGNHFLWTAKEFTQRLNKLLAELNDNTLRAATGSSGDEFICALLVNKESVGALQLFNGTDAISKEQENTQCVVSMLGAVEGAENISRVVLAMIETCDPSLGFEEVREIAKKVTANKEYSKNGITYTVSIIEEEDGALIGFTIGE